MSGRGKLKKKLYIYLSVGRIRDLRISRQSASTTAPGPPTSVETMKVKNMPHEIWTLLMTMLCTVVGHKDMKRETLKQYWINVGPSSSTLDQH